MQLKKMNLDIKKRYVMSRKNIYGIDNEQQIVSHIQKRLHEILS